jgi:hypothetical protein
LLMLLFNRSSIFGIVGVMDEVESLGIGRLRGAV